MEDSFRVRVDKVFGSLTSSNSTDNLPAPTSASLRSLWSLTDEEIERSRWRKVESNGDDEEDDDTESLSLSRGFLAPKESKAGLSRSETSFRRQIETDLDDLDDQVQDDDDDEKKSFEQRPDDYNEEEWEIKNSIGRDCTLDFEEEEDQFDKVAVGREKSEDRVYLKDLSKNEYEIDTGPSSSLEDALARDRRANHNAAKLRLKEDDESAARKIDSLTVSDNESAPPNKTSLQDCNLKSILKRKDDQAVDDSKSLQKRVRFGHECNTGEKETEDTAMEADLEDPLVYRMPKNYPSGIPDYMRNPTKYTKYTFESSDVDEGTNRQAYMDFLKLIKKSKPGPEVDESIRGDPPKSVPFVPRKKENNADDWKCKQEEGGGGKKGVNVVIAAADDLEGGEESCAMDEDEAEVGAQQRNGGSGSGRPGRRYRMKGKLEVDE
ncbi:unnamed protein product [Linum trigynum]|uniref:U5 small nuclear ribonucleoprotein TSSC4 n=1 Tax=Linum trigynum TaxID=586398 RepID=A0AAV2FL63_9ROSI